MKPAVVFLLLAAIGPANAATLTSAGPMRWSFEFLGEDADFTNLFEVDGQAIFGSKSAKQGNIWSRIAGRIEYRFLSPLGVADSEPSVGPSVRQATDGDGRISLWLDDGGAGSDGDYDDLGIRVSVSPVPVPASWVLFGSAIAAALSRRTA